MSDDLSDRIIGAESGGNATAKNPRSSATGAGQFINGTWLAMIAKHRPDLAGLPKDEQLALRTNPGLSREMTQAYADDNGAVLKSAGFEPTAGNTYLAHFAGPAGAKAVLGTDPSTPVAQVLPPASIAANSFLRPMTVGDLTAWAARKVGDQAPVMTMPGEAAGGVARAPFSLAGPVSSSAPAPTIPTDTPKADSGPDISVLLQTLMSSPAAAPVTPNPAPALPAPLSTAQLPSPLTRPAPAFDAARFFSLLPARAAR